MQTETPTLTNKEMVAVIRSQLKPWVGIYKEGTFYSWLNRIPKGHCKPHNLIAFARKCGFAGTPDKWVKE